MDSHTNNPSTSPTDNAEARNRFLESMGLGTETSVAFPAAEVPAEMAQAGIERNPLDTPSTEISAEAPSAIAPVSSPALNEDDGVVLSSQPDHVALPGTSTAIQSTARVVSVQVGETPATNRMKQAITSSQGAESPPLESSPPMEEVANELPSIASLEETPPPLESFPVIEDAPPALEEFSSEVANEPISDPEIEATPEESIDAASAAEEQEAPQDSNEPLQLHCPKCKEELILNREHIGVEGACVWCGTKIVAAESGTDREVRVFAVFQPDAEKEENETPVSEERADKSLPISPVSMPEAASDSTESDSEPELEFQIPSSEEIPSSAGFETAGFSDPPNESAFGEAPATDYPVETAPTDFLSEFNSEEKAAVPDSGFEAPAETPISAFAEDQPPVDTVVSEPVPAQNQFPAQDLPNETPTGFEAGIPEMTAPEEATEPAAQLSELPAENVADTQFSGSAEWPATPQFTPEEPVAAGLGEGMIEEPAPTQDFQYSTEQAPSNEAVTQGSADPVAESFASEPQALDQPAPMVEQPSGDASPMPFEMALDPMSNAAPVSTEASSPEENFTTDFAAPAAFEDAPTVPANENQNFAGDPGAQEHSPAPWGQSDTPPSDSESLDSTDGIFGNVSEPATVADTVTDSPATVPFNPENPLAGNDALIPATEAIPSTQELGSPMGFSEAVAEAPQSMTPDLPEETPAEMKTVEDPFSSAENGFAIPNGSENDAFSFDEQIPKEEAPIETPLPSPETPLPAESAESGAGAPPELPSWESPDETEPATEASSEVPAPPLEADPFLTLPAEEEPQPTFSQGNPNAAGNGLFAQAAPSAQSAEDAESEKVGESAIETPAASKDKSKISLNPAPISKKRPRKGLIVMVVVLMGFVCGAAAASFLLPVEEYVQKARQFVEETLDPASTSSPTGNSSSLPANAVASPELVPGIEPPTPPTASAPTTAPAPATPAAPAPAPSTAPTSTSPSTALAPSIAPASPASPGS